MHRSVVILVLAFVVGALCVCKAPRTPPEEIKVVNGIKTLIQNKLPLAIPQNLGFGINATTTVNFMQLSVTALTFLNADIDVPQDNTVHMQFTNLRWTLSFTYSVKSGIAAPVTGPATLMMANSSLTYTATLLPNDFKGTDAKLNVQDIVLTANNDILNNFWAGLRPQVIQGLTTQLPMLLLTLNTATIQSQVLPLIKLVEPIMLPNIMSSNFIGSITLSNMALYGIKVASANMRQGAKVNVVDFSMRNMSANATAAWSVTAPIVGTFSGKANVAILDVSTDMSFAFGVDNQNQFTYQLFSANMTIAGAAIQIDNKSKALKDIVNKLTPLVISELQSTIEKQLCTFVNGK